MSIAIGIFNNLAQKAKKQANAIHRSIVDYIEYWAAMGEILEDNPELSFGFVQAILISREQAKNSELTPYEFSE